MVTGGQSLSSTAQGTMWEPHPRQDVPTSQGHPHPHSLSLGQCRHASHLTCCTPLGCWRNPESPVPRGNPHRTCKLHRQWPRLGIDFVLMKVMTKQCSLRTCCPDSNLPENPSESCQLYGGLYWGLLGGRYGCI